MTPVCIKRCQTAAACQLSPGYDNAALYGANWPIPAAG